MNQKKNHLNSLHALLTKIFMIVVLKMSRFSLSARALKKASL